MKTITACLLSILAAFTSFGQGTLVFDQESSTDESYSGGAAAIQFYGTAGQSFTPSLSTVGFFRVKLFDAAPGNTTGATLIGTLRANAITGPVLGTAAPLVLSDSFTGSADFLFANPVSVVTNATYFFQVAVQTGDNWGIITMSNTPGDNYPNGNFYGGSTSFPAGDLWFREGIVVPEPSAGVLLLFGGSISAWLIRKRQ